MTESELTSSTMKRCEESDPDESSSGLGSLRESERIVAFTDAVVAVAITLLILPLSATRRPSKRRREGFES